MRQLGERRALRTQWRLLACASILRTVVTRILPLAGASAWWVTLLCLLPGYLLYALGCLGLRLTKTAALPDCARVLMGQAGVWLVYGLAAAALLVEGASSMTALITLFTEGIGTQGTQTTLAAVAAILLLFCLNKEGLARGIYFLRLPLAVMLMAVLAGLGSIARLDHAFPLLGGGVSSVRAAVGSGAGMGWVFLLPLLQEPASQRRIAEPLPPMLLCTACVALLNLALPHEVFTANAALADSLVLTVAFVGPFLRLIAICLWMAALFLSIASAASLGAQYALAPAGRELVWLPGAAAVCFAAAQWLGARELWKGLGAVEPWLLLALGVGAAVAILAGWRKRT